MLYLISVYSKEFVLLFLFTIYKAVDNMHIYKSLNINIGTITRNPEMVKFVSGHL